MADIWQKKVVTVVEIDIDRCNLVWGQGACNAALGGKVVRKCYNSYTTCAVQDKYDKGVNTLRFCMPTYPVKGGNYLPLLKDVGGYTQEVNLNGFDEQLLGNLGRRASINFNFNDMPYSDVLTDKYWQERISGAAQIDEVPYQPESRGSFWGKFKARNPNYAGRELRHITVYLDDIGAFIPEVTRRYVIESIDGPKGGDGVTVVAKDILSLADNKKALAPVTSNGKIRYAISDQSSNLELVPSGIGNTDYPINGHALIGSEIVQFSRSGDVITLEQRGIMGTSAASHSENDTFQLCYYTGWKVPIIQVIRDLFVDYGNIPLPYIDWAGWQEEYDKWGFRYVLTGIIVKPEEVIKLVGDICKCFSASIWWDAVSQKIKFKLNHPIFDENITEWNDKGNILKSGIYVEANDDERITRVSMNTVVKDPTKGVSEDNFLRAALDIYAIGEMPQLYGLPRTETINNRWMNHRDDTFAFILSGRLLARYKTAPSEYTIDIDNKDVPELTQVIGVTSYGVQDITGKPVRKLTQVKSIKDKKQGSTSTVSLQEFLFVEKYARFAPNGVPNYTFATPYEQNRYMFWSDDNGNMSNGDKGFRWA